MVDTKCFVDRERMFSHDCIPVCLLHDEDRRGDLYLG